MKREEVIIAFEKFGAVLFHILGRLFARFIPNEPERISTAEAAGILEMSLNGAKAKLERADVFPCDEKGSNGKELWVKESVLAVRDQDD